MSDGLDHHGLGAPKTEAGPPNGASSYQPSRAKGNGRIYRRKWSTHWWIQYSYRNRTHRESSGSDKRSDAVRLLRKRLAEIGAGRPVVGPNPERLHFEELVSMVVADYRVNGRRSLGRVEYALKHLRGCFGYHRALDITSDAVTTYIRKRLDAGAAKGTVAQELAALKRAFNLAVRAGRLASRPYIPSLHVENARKGFVEPPEFQAIHGHLPDYLQPPVLFMYLSGWRSKSEVLPLRWPQVSFETGVVRLEADQTKNEQPREFPFSALPQMEALLRRQRELTTLLEKAQGRVIPFVFHHDGQPLRNFAKAWKRACKAAGLVGLVPHDLRRSAVRNLVRAGVSETVAMRLCGHKTRAVFDRYNVTSGRDLREGVARLAGMLKPSADTAAGPHTA